MKLVKPYIQYQVQQSLYDGSVDIGGLEALLNSSFGVRNLRVVDGFLSPDLDNRLCHLVKAERKGSKVLGIPFPFLAHSEDAGVLIGTYETAETGFEFVYYDKIAVAPLYQGNGVMKSMIRKSRKEITGNSENDGSILPSILRTSDEKVSKKYESSSDICIKVGEYYIHGFGFLDKHKRPLFEDAAQKFNEAAYLVAAKPPTVVPISASTGSYGASS